jgi:quercetin dioxygenase-like cupin family protein
VTAGWVSRCTSLIACIACGSHDPHSATDSATLAGETRGALGAATGVRSVAGASGAKTFRVVPLGTMGGDVEILSGHPDSAGPFVMRIHELPGSIVPVHTHPVDENITVLQGTWFFASGDTFDTTRLRPMPAGTYAFAPAGTSMFGMSRDGAVVQVHGMGPFHIHWRDGVVTLDDSAASRVFRFHRGDTVIGPLGAGIVREGYASGALVQYEIERSAGDRYMAFADRVRLRH